MAVLQLQRARLINVSTLLSLANFLLCPPALWAFSVYHSLPALTPVSGGFARSVQCADFGGITRPLHSHFLC